jgi:hypothetical protein
LGANDRAPKDTMGLFQMVNMVAETGDLLALATLGTPGVVSTLKGADLFPDRLSSLRVCCCSAAPPTGRA